MGIDWEFYLGIDEGEYDSEHIQEAYDDSIPDDDYYSDYDGYEEVDEYEDYDDVSDTTSTISEDLPF